MGSLLKTNFLEITQTENTNYAIIEYFETTANMTTEDFKNGTLATIERMKILLNSSIKYFIFDTRNNYFPIEPDLQLWTAEQFEQFNIYNYKSAILVSSDIITNLSIEQTTEEFNLKNDQIETRFFDEIESALKWFNK